MADRHVIVVDMGSSGLRAHAVPVDRPWEVPPGAVRPYGVLHRPGELRRSINPSTLHNRLRDAVREAASTAPGGPRAVMAVAVTAQRGGTAFLDARGATLYSGPNMDLRAVFEGAELDERHGADIYASTGHLPSMFFTPAKLRWWQAHRPRQAERIATALTLGAWAVHALTGETAETAPSLTEAGLLDVCSEPPGPPKALLEALGVDPALLPPLLATGTSSGTLTREAADIAGLPPHTPVYLAGPDAQTAMLGMGIMHSGTVGIVAGWSAPVQLVTDRPVLDVQRRTWTGRHVLPRRWVLEANPSDTGATVDAVRRLLRLSHARFDAAAKRAAQSGKTAVALWGPRVLDLSSPGMSLGGLLLPVPVTHEGLDAGAVAKATLENVAYALRECIELVAEVAGDQASEDSVSLGGGMAGGSAFPAMLASALGRPVLLHHPRAAATGAAIIASRGVADWMHAAVDAAAQARVLDPDPQAVLEHGEAYERWKRLRAKLDEMADEL